ncbi:unnamed protein product [Bursaphelenchus xylophilus]|uniref:(pine wood nematode) hypothetical protein n=1 Tax=Bursaphelenchus xylophilus TaxID=6326 RepID=A0A1I7RNA5_BURXY|nr:unnamed protein product [Bursaphelenchus xylophilus]CAG9123812.1 unnamed protein product [Bursaphelenchus xylophilus]
MSSGAITNEGITDPLHRVKQLSTVHNQSNGSIKRPSSDDLNLHPAKRPNGEMAGMGMGGQLNEPLMDTIQIPENVVGLVIGRGGEQISNIQQQSGCRVQMAQDAQGKGFRVCTLHGSRTCIDRAKQLIGDVINKKQTGANGIPQQNFPGLGQPTITHEMLIPGNKCGLIIGKSGETIKGLQEQIGCKMLLVQESQHVSQHPKTLRISGSPDKVEQCKRAVEQLISEGGNASSITSMIQQKSVGEVIVPRSAVGIIIGKGGETIKRLAQESNTKIQFKPDEDPNASERCAVVQGTPEQITRATQMIWDLVQRSSGNQATEVCLMHVPANKTGLVIGKGGETIKQICNESGAHVELSRDPPPNATEKVFVIKGSPYNIHCAQHIIRIKVGDIPPGTPVPPMGAAAQTGGQYQSSQYGGSGDQYQNQWSQNGYGGGNNQYGGGAPAYQAAQTAQPAAQAQPGQNAQINPQTGQPDYSAQWADYYRSVGMHEQAAIIEQQMKGRPAGGAGQPQQQAGRNQYYPHQA